MESHAWAGFPLFVLAMVLVGLAWWVASPFTIRHARLVQRIGNSGGIGMLVTLLVRANRQHQELAAYGLSEHYREIFELTRLDEAITIYDNEESALNGVVK